jgi:two-component system, OmpR family, response regulator
MTVRALVVDDDRRLFELLSDYLGQNDIRASWAQDGATALALLSQDAFDAVLLDVMMPGMDGLATLKEIRRLSHIPIIMLTAKGDETDRVVGLELGADDYLAKPFSPRELLARIRAVLRRTQNADGEKLSIGSLSLARHRRTFRKGSRCRSRADRF